MTGPSDTHAKREIPACAGMTEEGEAYTISVSIKPRRLLPR